MFSTEMMEAIAECETAEEYINILADDVRNCCMNVAKGRALLNALEQLYPSGRPKGDRAIQRLRRYAVEAKWSWSTERAMALDLAELVEDMEAVKQKGDEIGLQYRAALLGLVGDKLDMDRGQSILEELQRSDGDAKEQFFRDLREATFTGWNRGIERVKTEVSMLGGDPLIYYKGYANMELEKNRFNRPASSDER